MVSLAKTIFEPSGEKHGELSVAFVFVIFLKPPPEAFAVQISAFPLEVSTTATFEPSRENEPPVFPCTRQRPCGYLRRDRPNTSP